MKKTCLIFGTPVTLLPFGFDEEDERCVELKLKIAETVSELAAKGITRFITDCEYGIPLWGAEAVLAEKLFIPELTLEIYMPDEEQAAKWAPEWRDRYFTVHEKADRVKIYNDRVRCEKELFSDADFLVYVGDENAEATRQMAGSEKMLRVICVY